MNLECEPSDDDFAIGFTSDELDMRTAFHELNTNYQEALLGRYARYNPRQPGDNREHKTVQRAVDKLAELMNRSRRKQTAQHDGPGSRTVVSNNQAREQVRRTSG